MNIVSRAAKLNRDTAGKWGTMDVNEMLLHCTLANKFILEDESSYRKQSLKQRVIKNIALYVILRFPKGRKGPDRINAKGKTSPAAFEQHLQEYINTIKRFPTHPRPFTSIHPGMGYLNNKEWGIAAWMHMDHHLRQFGV